MFQSENVDDNLLPK